MQKRLARADVPVDMTWDLSDLFAAEVGLGDRVRRAGRRAAPRSRRFAADSANPPPR